MINEGTKDRPGINHYLYNLIKRYDTGWINRSEWRNVHLGSSQTKNADSNVNHNLDAYLYELFVKILVSSTGSDSSCWEVPIVARAYDSASPSSVNWIYGVHIHFVDKNNILIQTGKEGIAYLSALGNISILNVQDWYYKIVVYKFSI